MGLNVADPTPPPAADPTGANLNVQLPIVTHKVPIGTKLTPERFRQALEDVARGVAKAYLFDPVRDAPPQKDGESPKHRWTEQFGQPVVTMVQAPNGDITFYALPEAAWKALGIEPTPNNEAVPIQPPTTPADQPTAAEAIAASEAMRDPKVVEAARSTGA